jgi:hypothetical protein
VRGVVAGVPGSAAPGDAAPAPRVLEYCEFGGYLDYTCPVLSVLHPTYQLEAGAG